MQKLQKLRLKNIDIKKRCGDLNKLYLILDPEIVSKDQFGSGSEPFHTATLSILIHTVENRF